MLLTLSFIPPLMKLSPIIKLIDTPNERKVHQKLIPRIGGIAIVLGAILPLVIWVPQSEVQWSLFLSIGVLLGFGIWDDRADLDFRIKLFGQTVSAMIAVFGADVRLIWLPFFSDTELPLLLSQMISIVALIGIINALNLVDGLDGLAGGSTLVGFSLIAFLAYQASDVTLTLLCLSVVGALLGFLRFNTHPASIFMGDSGSQFLGFVAGITCLRLTQQSDVGISPLFPLLLFAIPIFDTFVVMMRRVAQGRSPFSPDRNHIHHRLLAAGLDHYETVVTIYVVQGLLAFLGYYFRYHSDIQVLVILVSVLTLLFGALHWCDKNPNALGQMLSSHLATTPNRHQVKRSVSIFARCLLVVLFWALLTQSAFFTSISNPDLRILLLGLSCTFLIATLVYQGKPLIWVERLAIYILCSTAIFFYYHISAQLVTQKSITYGIFLCIFSLVIIGFQFSREHTFEFSPLDYLVILITLTLAFYPVSDPQTRNFTVCVSFLIGLFYSVEYILNSLLFTPLQLRLGLLLGCGAMFFSYAN